MGSADPPPTFWAEHGSNSDVVDFMTSLLLSFDCLTETWTNLQPN